MKNNFFPINSINIAKNQYPKSTQNKNVSSNPSA